MGHSAPDWQSEGSVFASSEAAQRQQIRPVAKGISWQLCGHDREGNWFGTRMNSPGEAVSGMALSEQQ
jgi:hypothetical protein